jgi:metal-responsive CopG/Arc/MetJ family transcriptional regulator
LITIEGGLLSDADRAARDSGKNRSQFIAEALRQALRRRAS